MIWLKTIHTVKTEIYFTLQIRHRWRNRTMVSNVLHVNAKYIEDVDYRLFTSQVNSQLGEGTTPTRCCASIFTEMINGNGKNNASLRTLSYIPMFIVFSQSEVFDCYYSLGKIPLLVVNV